MIAILALSLQKGDSSPAQKDTKELKSLPGSHGIEGSTHGDLNRPVAKHNLDAQAISSILGCTSFGSGSDTGASVWTENAVEFGCKVLQHQRRGPAGEAESAQKLF
jgi:hypothetical protein